MSDLIRSDGHALMLAGEIDEPRGGLAFEWEVTSRLSLWTAYDSLRDGWCVWARWAGDSGYAPGAIAGPFATEETADAWRDGFAFRDFEVALVVARLTAADEEIERAYAEEASP